MTNSIKIEKVADTASGCKHVTVFINGKDVGMLYLSQGEHDVLLNTLEKGAAESETTIEL